jgi:hypothetical protein
MGMRAVVFGTAIGVTAAVGVSQARRWWKTWGVAPDEASKPLPGDGIVPDPVAIETRGITIDAPPSAVWPWLVQMGYGRAGWYSYDQLDQRGVSAQEVVPAWQDLKVGDILPTHPGGGFEVAIVESQQALVVRSDTALVKAQAEAAKAAPIGSLDTTTVGVQASGAILGSTPQDFSASWAFVLEPVGEDRTRLIERFRIWYGEGSPAARFVMPFVGFGVFVMLQRQMTGIRERAEHHLEAVVSNGHRSTPPDLVEVAAPGA